jgi:putative nucleotidyltransferase with HDIG domain
MNMKILFVDDESNVLSGLRRMLRGQRDVWDMQFAASGPAALALMQQEPFDVIVTDMRMPSMDGAELLSRVSKQFPKTVRLVLSGQSEHEKIFRAIGPAHQFMSKPCDPDVLVGTIERACGLQNLMHDESLKQIISQVSFLPSLPTIYRDLVNALESDTSSVESIGEMIGSDIAMSAKVLQLVNSAFFGLPQHVSCPKHAASLLGLNILRPLVLLAGSYSQVDDPNLKGYSLERTIRHSMAVATSARAIAASQTEVSQLVDDAFIGGMMHDIGKLILAVNMSERYQHALDRSLREKLPLWQVELEMFGTSHAEIGAHLLGLWGLPHSIVEAVAFHHRPDLANGQEFAPLTAVHVANSLCQTSHQAADPSEQIRWNQSYLESIVSPSQLAKWRSMAVWERAA